MAIEKLNTLLSDKITPTCSSCGTKLPDGAKFPICEECFQQRRFTRRPFPRRGGPPGKQSGGKPGERQSNLASAVGSTHTNFRQGKPSKKRKFQGKPKK